MIGTIGLIDAFDDMEVKRDREGKRHRLGYRSISASTVYVQSALHTHLIFKISLPPHPHLSLYYGAESVEVRIKGRVCSATITRREKLGV